MSRSALGSTNKPQTEIEISKALESTKFQLLQNMARSKKQIQLLEQKIAAAEAMAFSRRQKLSEYNALFMAVSNASDKAPQQRLGAAEAVIGTKRIVERELTKLSKEAEVTEMKLNKAKEKILQMKAAVDSLRKEHLTHKKLFATMNDELDRLKNKIHNSRQEIEECYAIRDAAQEDMVKLENQFRNDKMVREIEWAKLTEEIELANRANLPDGDGTLSLQAGTTSMEQEQRWRNDLAKSRKRTSKYREQQQAAIKRKNTYVEALDQIRAATGYEDLGDVISLFSKYEEDKFAKVGAVSRAALDIEQLEAEVARLNADVEARDLLDEERKKQQRQRIKVLETQAQELENKVMETEQLAEFTKNEVKSLFPVIEYLFHAIGCETAVPEEGKKTTDNTTSAERFATALSPLRADTSSLKMFGSPTLAHNVRAGVTITTLGHFMGLIENRSADVIQQYAAAAATGALDRVEYVPDAANVPTGDEDAGKTITLGGVSYPVEGLNASTEPQKRYMSSAALGPSKPTGKLKESLTTSAMVTAFAITMGSNAAPPPQNTASTWGATSRSTYGTGRSIHAMDDDADYDRDGMDMDDYATNGTQASVVRPLPISELKKQAAMSIANDKMVKSLTVAASTAAGILSRAQ